MNSGLGSAGSVVVEEFEIAAFIGLGDFLFEEFSVAAGESFFGRSPGGATGREFFLADVKRDGAISGIEFDHVTILHESERAADRRFRRNVEDAGAVGSAGHAGIGDAEEIANAFFEEVFRDGKHAGFGNAGGADGSGILHDEDVLLGDAESGIVDAGLHVGIILEDDGGAFVLQELLGGGGGFDDGSVGSEVAAEDGGSALFEERFVEGEDDVVVVNFGSIETFAEGFSEDGGCIEMEKVSDAIEETREATGVEEIGHDVFSGRSQIGEDGCLAGDLVEEFERQVNAGTFGESGDMDDGIGGTSDGHVGGDGIFEGFAGEVLGGLEVFPNHIDDAEPAGGGHA